MEQVLSESNIEIPASSKDWEPQRGYAKRLENVMNKGKGGPSKPRRRGKNATTGASSDEEASEVENLLDKPAEKEKPRPRPRRVTRSNPVIEENEEEIDDAAAPTTPKARPRPRKKATYRSRSRGGSSAPSTDHEDEEPDHDQEDDQQSDVVDQDQQLEGADQTGGEAVTPKSSSRKRTRPDDEEEEDPEAEVRSPSVDVETTPVNEVRRKRIRH